MFFFISIFNTFFYFEIMLNLQKKYINSTNNSTYPHSPKGRIHLLQNFLKNVLLSESISSRTIFCTCPISLKLPLTCKTLTSSKIWEKQNFPIRFIKYFLIIQFKSCMIGRNIEEAKSCCFNCIHWRHTLLVFPFIWVKYCQPAFFSLCNYKQILCGKILEIR